MLTFGDAKMCRNALLRRAAGARDRTNPFVLLTHIAIPRFREKLVLHVRVRGLSVFSGESHETFVFLAHITNPAIPGSLLDMN